MADLNDSFDALMQPDQWMEFAAVGAGYMGASVAQVLVDPMLPVDAPNEFYGVAVAAGGMAYSPQYERAVAAGGGLYALDAFAQRFGLKSQIRDVAASQGGN